MQVIDEQTRAALMMMMMRWVASEQAIKHSLAASLL